jgi:hemolysin activation/secretion protein
MLLFMSRGLSIKDFMLCGLKQAAGSVILGLASFSVLYHGPVHAVAGYESTDRPSEWRPGLPYYKPSGPPEGFELPAPPKAEEQPFFDSTRLRVRSFKLSGNTAFSTEILQGLMTEFLAEHAINGELTIDELELMRKAISQFYISRGYVNSGAKITGYEKDSATVMVQIVEGRIQDIVIRGAGGLTTDYIRSRLLSDEQAPFNIQELQENFQLLLNDPLMDGMNGKIRPGDGQGQAILDLDIQRAKPYGMTTFTDNYRPPSIGAVGAGASGWVRNMTGLGDAFALTVVGSGGSIRYSGGYSIPLFGTKAIGYINFDEGNSQVIESSFQNLNIKSQVHIGEIGASYPLIESLRRRLVMGGLFSIRANDTSVLGQPYSFVPGVVGGYTQVTVARAYQEYTERWSRHALSIRNTLSFGMSALGSTPANQNFPSSQFVSWLLQSQYAYLLNDEGAQIILRENLQLTNHPLLPLERIAVGGGSTVRGYRTNFMVRDEGYTLSAELRYPLESFSFMDYPVLVTVYPFTDFGEAWDLGGPRNQIWSVGSGINFKYVDLQADLNYGYALIRPNYSAIRDIQDDGIYFRVTYEAL